MQYVMVQTYSNYIEAHLAMNLLESEYINCWLKDEHSISVNPGLVNAVGGIKLMVVDTQAERAVQVLRDIITQQPGSAQGM